MSTLRLALDEPGRTCRPGAALEVDASWYLDGSDHTVELNLVWYTSGKGTQDIEVAEQVILTSDTPGSSGSRRHTLRLPEGPYSFSGKLITLAWALELVALPSSAVERVDLVIAPEGREVDLRTRREH
jgi:hypothetical protein